MVNPLGIHWGAMTNLVGIHRGSMIIPKAIYKEPEENPLEIQRDAIGHPQGMVKDPK